MTFKIILMILLLNLLRISYNPFLTYLPSFQNHPSNVLLLLIQLLSFLHSFLNHFQNMLPNQACLVYGSPPLLVAVLLL